MRPSSEKGYALIAVLAFIVIGSILSMPYLSTFLQDTREMQIETVKNQNNYLLESAVDITKAIVEANNIMSEDDLTSVMDNIELNSQDLFGKNILTEVNTDNNSLFYKTTGSFLSSRSDYEITITYQTYDKTIFKNNKIVVKDKDDPGSKIKGNNHFMTSFLSQDILGVSSGLFDGIVQDMYAVFAGSFTPTSQDLYYDILDENYNSNVYLNSLWVDGYSKIRGNGGSKPDFTINTDFYSAGDLEFSSMGKIKIDGDLVVYNGSLDLNSINSLRVGGSLIVKGDIKITGSPNIKATNISAADIHITSNNTDVFPLEVDGEGTEETGEDGEEGEDGLPSPDNDSNYIDGQLQFNNWKVN